MKFLIDAQLSSKVADWIQKFGHDAVAIRELHSQRAPDEVVWQAALSEGRVIVTKDHDFPQWALTRQPCAQVVWIRSGNGSNRSLIAQLEAVWGDVLNALENGERIVEVGRR